MRIQVISNLDLDVYSENATFDAQSNLLRAILGKMAATEGNEYFLQRSPNISCSDRSRRAFTLNEDIICMKLTCECTHTGQDFDNLHTLLARVYGVTVLHMRIHVISVYTCMHVCIICACVCVYAYINMCKQ